MGPKSDVFTANQVKEILKQHEETIINFFNAALERVDAKMVKLIEENALIKKELEDVKQASQFQSDIFEAKVSHLQDKSNAVNDVIKENERLEGKITELEDRSRRNNLRIDGLIEDDNETWQETENKVKKLIKETLKLNHENIKIERAHRSGKFTKNGKRNDRRTIIARFLDYKDKEVILDKFREKKLWEKQIYINEDFSEKTVELRKQLFLQAKTARNNGMFAKVVYNKLIVHDRERKDEYSIPHSEPSSQHS